MPKLRHIWKKDKDFEPNYHTYEKHDCTRCGLSKYKESYKTKYGKRIFEESYVRDLGRTFDELPECIDWDDNTLD
jgi:hypothetical protein